MNESQKVACGLLVPCCDTAIVLDPVHEALHEVAGLVPALAVFAGLLAVAARRDHSLGTALVNLLHQVVGVVAFIRNHGFWLMFREQLPGAGDVVFLARAKAQFQRLSLGIYGEMQFRAESAARASEGFLVRSFLGEAPAEC